VLNLSMTKIDDKTLCDLKELLWAITIGFGKML
jgi:hypothetical protein